MLKDHFYNRDKEGAWQFDGDEFEPDREDDEHFVGRGGDNIQLDAVKSENEATSISSDERSNSDGKDLSENELESDTDDSEGDENDYGVGE